jgi:hypothetical protein
LNRKNEDAQHRSVAFFVAALCTAALLLGCTPTQTLRRSAGEGDGADPIEAAFVLLGPDGQPVARVITRASECPLLRVDDIAQPMTVRAAPAIVPPRPTTGKPENAKASAFPVLVCDALIGARAVRVSVAGRSLPLPRSAPKMIVVIGDTGCRAAIKDEIFQACNDPVDWPFSEIAAAAAATHPDLVIHVGDYHYRESACPEGKAGCAGTPWGYGWDTWTADFFAPAQPLLAAAPWIVVRGNHESCNRAGQGWWRFLDPRPLGSHRDCNDPNDDAVGDFSEPYAVPIGREAQLIVFDSSKAGLKPLASDDPTYRTYAAQLKQAFALARRTPRNFFLSHHPALGFAPNPALQPTGLYPGNEALQSVLRSINGERLSPAGVQAQLSGHVHLFEMVSFASAQPTQIISGNGGTRADAPLPSALARGSQPSPGAVVEAIVSTTQFGFLTMEQDQRGAWRIEARNRRGQPISICALRGSKTRCDPETLP